MDLNKSYQYGRRPGPKGADHPDGTPFDDCYATTTNIGASSADSPVGVHTGNYYTTLYTEPQEPYHTNVNTHQ